MKRVPNIPSNPGRRRSGAMLAEVLIAILAMSIGVISLISLFPIAVLRSVQGNQLTVGTGHRLNTEAVLDANPYLWVDPDRDNNFNVPATGNVYLVDPLWYSKQSPIPAPATPQTTLGTTAIYHSGFNTPALAESLSVYDASWVDVADENLGILYNLSSATSVTLAATTNLNAVGSGSEYRIVFYDANGRSSATRKITTVTSPLASPVVSWADPLTISAIRVRVEVREQRFSWLMTCRRHDVAAKRFGDIYIAEFFRREIPVGKYSIYQNAGANTFPVNVAFQAGQDVAYFSNVTAAPLIRRGGYVLDADNGHWYGVADFEIVGTNMRLQLEKKALATGNTAVFMPGIVDVYYLGTKQF